MPAATLVILLPPLFKPLAVNLTSVVVPPVGALMVMPLLSTKVLPVVTLSNLAFLANSMLILPLASVRVMTFSPEVAVEVLVIPPLTPMVSPN